MVQNKKIQVGMRIVSLLLTVVMVCACFLSIKPKAAAVDVKISNPSASSLSGAETLNAKAVKTMTYDAATGEFTCSINVKSDSVDKTRDPISLIIMIDRSQAAWKAITTTEMEKVKDTCNTVARTLFDDGVVGDEVYVLVCEYDIQTVVAARRTANGLKLTYGTPEWNTVSETTPYSTALSNFSAKVRSQAFAYGNNTQDPDYPDKQAERGCDYDLFWAYVCGQCSTKVDKSKGKSNLRMSTIPEQTFVLYFSREYSIDGYSDATCNCQCTKNFTTDQFADINKFAHVYVAHIETDDYIMPDTEKKADGYGCYHTKGVFTKYTSTNFANIYNKKYPGHASKLWMNSNGTLKTATGYMNTWSALTDDLVSKTRQFNKYDISIGDIEDTIDTNLFEYVDGSLTETSAANTEVPTTNSTYKLTITEGKTIKRNFSEFNADKPIDYTITYKLKLKNGIAYDENKTFPDVKNPAVTYKTKEDGGYSYAIVASLLNPTVSAQYTIKYDSNGGSTIEDTTKRHGFNTTITTSIPTKPGFKFLGWAKTKSATVPDYFAGATYTANENIELYAVYANATHTITFDYGQNGGHVKDSTNKIVTKTFVEGEKIALPTDAVKDAKTGENAWIFNGWTKKSNGLETSSDYITSPFDTSSVTDNITLYAGYQRDVNVIFYDFDYNSETKLYEEGGVEYDLTIHNNAVYNGYNVPDPAGLDDLKTGVEFLGWSKSNDTKYTDLKTDKTPVSTNANLNFYAVYKVPVTLSYDANGGSFASGKGNPETIHFYVRADENNPLSNGKLAREAVTSKSSFVASSSVPSKTGYTVIGWNTKADGSGTSYNIGDEVLVADDMHDIKLYAMYEKNTGSVKWNYYITKADGKTTEAKQVTEYKNYDDTITKPADTDVYRYGYTFKGWTPEVPAKMGTSDLEFIAVYEANNSKIRFYNNYPDAPTDTSYYETTAPFDGEIVYDAEKAPSRSGYTFEGWSKTKGGAVLTSLGNVTEETGENGHIDFYAVWSNGNTSCKYNVYEMNTSGNYELKTSSSLTAATGSVIDMTKLLELPDGFFYDTAHEGYKAKGTVEGSGNTIFNVYLARKSYTLTFDPNGGYLNNDVSKTAKDEQTYLYGTSIIADTAKKTRYSFSGWKEKDDKVDGVPSTMPDENLYFVAQWEVQKYKITFDCKGGSPIAPIEQNYGTNIAKPGNPTKEGYKFVKWDKAIPSTMPAENMTVTAEWAKETYTIKFETNGGTKVNDIVASYGEPIAISSATVKNGYTFGGWTETNGSSIEYELPATMPDLGEDGAEKTLYAIWLINGYKVTFDADGGKLAAGYPSVVTTEFTAALPTAKADKEHFELVGWKYYLDKNHNNEYTGKTMPANDLYALAQWKRTEYKVTYDYSTNGGTKADFAEKYVSVGEDIIEKHPNAATKQGWEFVGWNTDKNACEGLTSLNATQDIALYAIYKKTITARFVFVQNINEDEDEIIIFVEPVSEDIYNNETSYDFTYLFEYFEGPQFRMGCKNNPDITAAFCGFIKEGTVVSGIEDLEANYVTDFTISEDTLFISVYEFGFTATFTDEDESFSFTEKTNPYYVFYNTDAFGFKLIHENNEMPEAPKKNHYKFNQWIPTDSYADIISEDGKTMYMLYDDEIFIAEYIPDKYTLSFTNTGDTTLSPITKAYGTQFNTFSTPVKKGYTFTGWTINDLPVTFPFVLTEDTVAMATWSKNSYTITYDTKGGSPVETKTVPYGDTLPEAETIRAGYNFIGWTYKGEEEYTDAIMPDFNLTATAGWKASDNIEYTVNTYIMDESGNYPDMPSESKKLYGTTDSEISYSPETKTGFTLDTDRSNLNTIVSVNADDIINVYYIRNKYNVKITYMMSDGTNAPAAINESVYYGKTYSYDSPAVTGYAANIDKISDKMGTENKKYTVTYTPNDYTITFDTNGGSEISSIVAPYRSNIDKPENPTKTGYTFVKWDKTIPDTMPAENLTIRAIYSINQYTITVDPDNGSEPIIIKQDYDTDIEEPEEPTKEGHSFREWNKEIPEKMPAENIDIKALWDVESYTISFDSNGGTPVSAITNEYGKEITKPENPTKTGYTFAGWFEDNKLTQTYEIPSIMPDLGSDGAVKTVYAKWDINSYTITIDPANGDEPTVITQDYNSDITKPENPEKTGYTFREWNIEIPETMPAENITITALYDINQYTITFDTVGGTPIDAIAQDYGTNIVKPEDPKKTGYTFRAWDTEIPATMPAENITITALYDINQYTITFDTDGGTPIDPITQDYNSSIAKPENPEKTGYTFREWSVNIPDTMPAENIAITALYDINQYTITFDTDGGSEVNPITADYGSEYDKPENPVKPGYTFIGWEPELPETIPANDISTKALWSANDYTVHFDANTEDFTGEMSDLGLVYDTEGSLPENQFKHNNAAYTFCGWNTNESGTGVHYEDKATVLNVAGSDADSVTLYAMWMIVEKTSECNAVKPGETVNYKISITIPEAHQSIKIKDTLSDSLTYVGNANIEPTTVNDNELEWVFDSENEFAAGTKFDISFAAKINDCGNAVSIANTAVADVDEKQYLSNTDVETTEYINIFYSGNGNTSGEAPVDEYDYTKAENIQVLGSGTLSKDGYLFAGWNTKADGTGRHYDENDAIATGSEYIAEHNGSVTLYAQWLFFEKTSETPNGCRPGETINYTITIKVPEETHSIVVTDAVPGTIDILEDSFNREALISNNVITWAINENIAPGETIILTFSGKILVSENGTEFANTAKALIGDKYEFSSTTAANKIGYCKVQYCKAEDEAGAAPVDENFYLVDETATVLENESLTKGGFEFVGWCDEENNNYPEGSTITIDKDIILHAAWGKATKAVETNGTIKPGTSVKYTINVIIPDGIENVVVTDKIADCLDVTDFTNDGNITGTVDKDNNGIWTIAKANDKNEYEIVINGILKDETDSGLTIDNIAKVDYGNGYSITTNNASSKVGYEINYVEGDNKYTDGNYYEHGTNATIGTPKYQGENTFFFGWNSRQDGTGETYRAGDVIEMNDNLTLYSMSALGEKALLNASNKTLPGSELEYSIKFSAPYSGVPIVVSDKLPSSLKFAKIENDASWGNIVATDNELRIVVESAEKDRVYEVIFTAIINDDLAPESVIENTAEITIGDISFATNTAKLTTDKYFKVVYNANGADGEHPVDGNLYLSGMSADILSGDTLKLKGYVFKGWTTDKDGNGKVYQAGDKIEADADVVLYALFEKEIAQDDPIIPHTGSDATVSIIAMTMLMAAGSYIYMTKKKKSEF